MKSKILKTSAALALGLALVAPTTANVYATEQKAPTAEQTELDNAKNEFDKAVKNAEEKLANLKLYRNTAAYINEKNVETKQTYDAQINQLDSIITGHKAKTKTTKDDYLNSTNTINITLNAATKATEALSGKEVNNEELAELVRKKIDFVRSENYTKAEQAKKDAYDKAVKDAEEAVKDRNISEETYNQRLTSLKNAIDAIDRPVKTASALENLKAEIKEADKIVKSEYTAKSYKTFSNALVTAKTLANTANPDLDLIQTTLDALKEAREGLVKKPDENLETLITNLEAALKKAEIRAEAARLLIEKAPKTIKSIKPDLEKLIVEYEVLEKEARVQIDNYRKIKG